MKYLGILALSLFFILLANDVKATHIVGGDMTYKKIGPNRFLITLNLRRDCFLGADNAQFDNPAKIGIYRGTTNSLFQFVSAPYMDDDTLNNYVQSDCGFEGTQVCVHETQYRKIIDLPFFAGGYTVTYQRCCRNGSINNIVDPLETGATYSVHIPAEAFDIQNSSPSFVSWPDVYICAGKELNFLNKAVDPDGDSLVYKLCTPKIGLTKGSPADNPTGPPYTDLTWKAPYNLSNLMGGVPLKIDPKTGLMTAIPNTVGQFVIGVCVEEWRNGKKIGEIRRDFQYNVRVCSTPPTAIFEAPSVLCNVKTVSFVNNSLASNQYFWNFNFPSTDPAFTSTERSPTFTFPANGTYQVKLTVIRGSDNCKDEEIKTIRITDLPYNADFGYDILSCNPDGTVTIILTDQSTTPDVGIVSNKWNWKVTQGGNILTSTTNPATFTITPGDFAVEFNVDATNGCKGSVSRNVNYDSRVFKSDFVVEQTGCDPNNNQLIKLVDLSQTINDNYTVNERKWKVFYNGQQIELFGNNVIATIPRKDFRVELDVDTDEGCRNILNKDFKASDFIPTVDFDFSLSGCDVSNNAIIKFVEKSNDNVIYSQVTSYNWTIDGQNFNTPNVDYVSELKKAFNAKLSIIYSGNCSSDITKPIDVNQLRPKVNFTYTPSDCPDDNTVNLIFKSDESGFNGISNNGINWRIGNLSNIQDFTGNTITVPVPKDSLISASIGAEFANGCVDVVKREFTPGPFATLKLIYDSLKICKGDTTFLIKDGNPLLNYTWTPNTGLDLSDPSKPILTGVSDQIYTVKVSDGLCSVLGQVKIDVLDALSLSIDGNNFTCNGDVELEASGSFGPGNYEWSTTPTYSTIINTTPVLKTNFTGKEITYYVRFKGDNTDACDATPAQLKVINQTPVIETVPNPICKGDTIPFNVLINANSSHQNTYTWKPDPHIISGANTKDPVVGATLNDKDFTLYVSVKNQFGCELNDSIEVKLSENPKVAIDYSVKDCDKFEVCFKYTVTGTSYGFPKWEFGDGNTSPLKEACNKYSKEGEYTVVLKNLTQVCPWADTPVKVKLNKTFPVFDNKSVEDCINSDFTLTLPEKAKNRPFVWLDLDGKIISTDPNPKVNVNSDTSFVLNVKDDNGCPFNDTFSIKAFIFDINLDAQDTVCTTGQYLITSKANQGINFIYSWSPANAVVSGGNTATPTVDVAKAQKFTAKLKHPTLGCEASEDYTFNYFKYDYKIEVPKVYCLNGEAQPIINVAGNVNYIYEWKPTDKIISGGNTNKPVFDIDGKYEIKVKVTHPTLGCVLRDSFRITPFEPAVEVKAEPNTTVPKNATVDVSVVNPKQGWKYVWSNGFVGTTQKVKIISDTIFMVTATDENGCTAETEIRLDNRPPICEEDVFLPTAFSPNGDGNNDVYYIRSNYVTDVELIIYNRWNQQVFTTKDINIGWDGRLNGEELAPDVYAYWYRAKCTDGKEIIKRGNVSLLR